MVLVSTHDDRLTHIADRVIELVPHFKGADREPEEVRLEPGQILFDQGDRGDLVYVVEEGEIEIFRVPRPTAMRSHSPSWARGTTSVNSGPCSTCPAALRRGLARHVA